MICKARRSTFVPITASTASKRRGLLLKRTRGICVALLVLFAASSRGEALDPEVGRMLERAVQQADNLRKELQTSEYEAKMRVQEWDARGRLRGTAKAHALVRPGTTRSMTFISREVEGKVRLPNEKEEAKDEEKPVTMQDFAREHRIAERFEFRVIGTEVVAGQPTRRVAFEPKTEQPEKKSTADRFLSTISGTAWVSEGENKLLKFDLKLLRPFQLLWIFAVLKELTIEYELLEPGEILGHARLKVLFALTTPVYSLRQLHEVDLDKFRRRTDSVAVR
jgi:hypothetical protein